MTDARLVFKTRSVRIGGVVEIVVWQVPKPVPPSEHAFKYRLVYVKNGQRVVGYDNERGKGDHKHLGEVEMAYRFVDIDTLMADFLRDVEAFE
jgi:hypothetical protein